MWIEIPFFREQINEEIGTREFPSVFYAGGLLHAFYLTDTACDIRHATSQDGVNWTDDLANNPVLEASEQWEGGALWICEIWREGLTWYMLYGGRRSGNDWPIGLARSNDGVVWTKEQTNPVLEGTQGGWDDSCLDASAVYKIGSTYYLWYSTYCQMYNGITNRLTGLATSTDLVNWLKSDDNPIFTGYQFCPAVFRIANANWMVIAQHRAGTHPSLEVYRAEAANFSDRECVGDLVLSGDVLTSGYLDWPKIVAQDIERTQFVDGKLYIFASKNGPGAYLMISDSSLPTLTGSSAQPRACLKVSQGANQQLSRLTYNVLHYDHVDYDPLGGWDAQNHEYIIHQPGIYEIAMQLTLKTNTFSDGDRVSASPAKNGSQFLDRYWTASGTNYQSVPILAQMDLAYGDRISGRTYPTSNPTVWGNVYSNFMMISLIQRM